MLVNWKEINMKKVGEKLALVRKSKNQTQREFIKDCDIEYRQYSKYETGKQKPIYNEKGFFKLVAKHNINLDWLLHNNHINHPEQNQKHEVTVSMIFVVKDANGEIKQKISFQDESVDYYEKVKKTLLQIPIKR